MDTSRVRPRPDGRLAAITSLVGLHRRGALTTAHVGAVAREPGVAKRTAWRWLARAAAEGVVAQLRAVGGCPARWHLPPTCPCGYSPGAGDALDPLTLRERYPLTPSCAFR